MALITCPECGNAVSDKAATCIHCGFPISSYLAYEPQPEIEDNFTPYTPRRTAPAPKHVQKPTHSRAGRKKKKRKRKWLVWVIVIVFTLIIASLISTYRHVQEEKRKMGQALVNAMLSEPEPYEFEQSYFDTPEPDSQLEYQPEYQPEIVNFNSEAYAAYHRQLTSAQYGDIYFARYYLYDMDHDGIDELIVIAGTCDADAQLIVYDYYNGEAFPVGTLSGGHSIVYGSSAGDGFILHFGHMGHEIISNVTSTSAGLSVSELLNRETENYSYMDYFVELTPYYINDFTPFGITTYNSYTTESVQHSYEPKVGMTMEKVLRSSWGKPLDVTKYTSSLSVTEIWFYEKGTIMFRDGIVDIITE